MEADIVQLEHGSGGRLSRQLIENEILPLFGDGPLRGLPDGATLARPETDMVFTTDTYVVQPLEFPGGNIGNLAVHGTVNDLAVCGSVPRWLSLGLIVEEGLPLVVLRRMLGSARDAAQACGVTVATGDTKVVARGQCDGLYLNSSGIGERLPGFELGPDRVRAGDHVLVNGSLGDHGLAVLACRENIEISGGPSSDTGPVHRLVAAAQEHAAGVRFMRDPTRGGAAGVLNEIVQGREFGIELCETDLPLSQGGKAVAEMLGLDPLNVACEGRLIMVCAADVSEAVLAAWRELPEGVGATRIGLVDNQAGRVSLRTSVGGRRLVDVPRGELLPRIC